MSQFPKNCARCGADLGASTVSKFNAETICLDCKDDERLAPNYKRADEEECAAVRGGDYNYPGIGLAPEDNAFMTERRRTREKAHA
jgi:hypothetical protein